MQKDSQDFLNKIKFNTHIYTFIFITVSAIYTAKYSVSSEPLMLLIAAFAFYTIGRQITVVKELESGGKVDTQPKAPAWIRGVAYLVVMLMIFSVIFL